KLAKLIYGYRWRPKGDLEAAVDAVSAAADYVVCECGRSTYATSSAVSEHRLRQRQALREGPSTD
ncbi:hypothetical protein ACC736_39565, partial [Rhizobium ruizarguesonis]